MKVSIITVCLNAKDTIEETIKSIASQAYQNIEHIIIDGGSTDGTLEIIEKYKSNIAYLVSEPDNGIFNAQNKGIKAATGDILYFLNANDYLFDEKVVEDAVDFFKNTGAKMVFGDMSFIDKNGHEKERRIYSDVDKLFFINECICHQGVFYKREVFDICGLYDENYLLTADYDLNLKVIMLHKLKTRYFNRVIAKFTLGGQSNTNSTLTTQRKEKQDILSKNFKSYHFKMNRILNKTFRSIARNPKLRGVAGKVFGFSL